MTQDVMTQDVMTLDNAGLLSSDQYRQKMQRRLVVQAERLAQRTVEKGLIIVHTGNGKGKTTAALGARCAVRLLQISPSSPVPVLYLSVTQIGLLL